MRNDNNFKKSATIGEFTIGMRRDGSIDVLIDGEPFSGKVKGMLRNEIAPEAGFDVDHKWTTRQLGSKLIDHINSSKDPDKFTGWSRELYEQEMKELPKIKAYGDALNKRDANRLSGDIGHIIKQCKASAELREFATVKDVNQVFEAIKKTKGIEKTRSETFSENFNEFWNNTLGTDDEDYFNRLKINDFVRLKTALKDIHNLITLKTTLLFLEKLKEYGVVNEDQRDEMINDVNRQDPCTNGYDVQYPPKKKVNTTCNDKKKIIAEVKCNIPVGKNSFGAKQKEGVINDLIHLKEGKGHHKGDGYYKDYYKFFVLLDAPGVKDAMKNVHKTMKEKGYVLNELKKKTSIIRDCIYIVYIDYNNSLK